MSCSTSQLNRQLVEQQNSVTSDGHEDGAETNTSESQPDSVLALKERIAELEAELEAAKHEQRKTLVKSWVSLHTCLYTHIHTHTLQA